MKDLKGLTKNWSGNTMIRSSKSKKIKLGIVGTRRGKSFMDRKIHELLGLEAVAVCDNREEKLNKIKENYDAAVYTDYDAFLKHDMDAVVLANYFHEHAPFALKALEAGKHVLSETSCNATLSEGVALCRKVEETGLTYMLAENYPYTKFNMEMQRLYQADTIGEVTYAEGEYNHPSLYEERLRRSPGRNHWRSWYPSTYYCTHALAPLMYITGTMPVKINGLSIAPPALRENNIRANDPGSVILCRMDNGSVFRIFGINLPGHSNWYRVHGTRGAMETTRGPGYFGLGQIRVWHEKYDLNPGEKEELTYLPGWPEYGELADKAGHGGGDFWVQYYFSEAIRKGKKPFLDVYRGVAMSSAGILAWKSALEDGKPFDMPDFRDEESRRRHEDDNFSPFPDQADTRRIPASIMKFTPKREAFDYAEKIWQEIGYIEPEHTSSDKQ